MKTLLENKFKDLYGKSPSFCISNGGRIEVLGNHTDHNNGLCIAGTCSLAIYAAVGIRDDKKVSLISEGYPKLEADLSSLDKIDGEKGNNKALIRGIAYYLYNKGYKVGGFDIYMTSTIPSGAGVSSSAAFELLIGEAFNYAFNNDKIERLVLCQAGQFAERDYYGKMCGLLDQIGVGYGGYTFIDFKTNPPHIESLKIAMKDYSFLIVNSGGSHANLSHLYKDIPDDMYKVAGYFGKKVLRDVSEDEVVRNEEKFSSKEFARAKHFYGENKRVLEAVDAIKSGNIEKLINLINETRQSCIKNLKNMCVEGQIEGSPLEACNFIDKVSELKAGVKINGGGFAGSVIALLSNSIVDKVMSACKEKYGENNVHLVSIRNDGPIIF